MCQCETNYVSVSQDQNEDQKLNDSKNEFKTHKIIEKSVKNKEKC